MNDGAHIQSSQTVQSYFDKISSPRHLHSKSKRKFFIFLKLTILENLNLKKSTILVGKFRKSSYDVYKREIQTYVVGMSKEKLFDR